LAADSGWMRHIHYTILGLALLFAAGAGHAAPPVTPLDDAAIAKQGEEYWAARRKEPSEAPFAALLKSGDFATLEQKVEAVQRDYEARKVDEGCVYAVFHTFQAAKLETDVTRWAQERPRSWAAVAARGLSQHAQGNRARGGATIRETAPQQLLEMESRLAAAERDYRSALAQRPRFLPLYSYLIDIAQKRGDQEMARTVLEEALRQDPATFFVRDSYMGVLQPKWGGSWEAMEHFAQSAQAHVGENPHLVTLLGDTPAARAYERVLRRDWPGARDLYTEAMRFGSEPLWLSMRAKAYQKMDQCPAAVADLTEAIRLDPTWAELHAERAWCRKTLGQGDAAFEDYARAVELAPDTYWMVTAYATALERALRPRDAVAVYEKFLATHPDHAEAFEAMGVIYKQSLHEPDRAGGIFKLVVKLAPDRASAWRNYGDVLRQLHDDATARIVYARYLELAANTTDPVERLIAPAIRSYLATPPPPASIVE
jgi:tetratricopeptide (TPR) repeat protein